MRKGQKLPQYQCRVCGHTWAQGGWRKPCPKCGGKAPHKWVKLAVDGDLGRIWQSKESA